MAEESEIAKRLTDKLRRDTGRITDRDSLVCFLYLLMRDKLPPGTIAELLRDSQHGLENVYTNGWLAKYAQWVAKELRNQHASDSENRSPLSK